MPELLWGQLKVLRSGLPKLLPHLSQHVWETWDLSVCHHVFFFKFCSVNGPRVCTSNSPEGAAPVVLVHKQTKVRKGKTQLPSRRFILCMTWAQLHLVSITLFQHYNTCNMTSTPRSILTSQTMKNYQWRENEIDTFGPALLNCKHNLPALKWSVQTLACDIIPPSASVIYSLWWHHVKVLCYLLVGFARELETQIRVVQ